MWLTLLALTLLVLEVKKLKVAFAISARLWARISAWVSIVRCGVEEGTSVIAIGSEDGSEESEELESCVAIDVSAELGGSGDSVSTSSAGREVLLSWDTAWQGGVAGRRVGVHGGVRPGEPLGVGGRAATCA